MKSIQTHILEKLKVSKSNITNVTFEKLVDAIYNYVDAELVEDMDPAFMLTRMMDEKDLPEFEYYTNPRSNGIAKLYGLDITYTKQMILIYFRYETKEYIEGQYDNRNIKSLDDLYKFIDPYILEEIYEYLTEQVKK